MFVWSAGQSVWSVPHQAAEPTYDLRADCSTCAADQITSSSTTFPSLAVLVHSSSPHGSASSSRATAISISPKLVTSRNGTGRRRGLRYHSASQNKLANSIQGNLSFHSLKHKESPEKVWAKQRRAQAVALGTIVTRLHIGAALLGSCTGFCPYPGAQAKALEILLQQQNPARWEAGLAKHKQIAVEQQVQQVVSTCCPDLQQHLLKLQQVTAFGVLPEAKLKHEEALADVKACIKKRMAEQEAPAKPSAQPKTELGSAAVAAPAVAAATAAALVAAAKPASTPASAPPAAPETVLAAALEAAPAPSAAAAKEAELTEFEVAEEQAEHALPTQAAAACSLADAFTPGGAQDNLLPESTYAAETVAQSSRDTTIADEATSDTPQQLQLLTKADVQLVLDFAKQSSNCAYGRQAEHTMVHDFELAAQQAQPVQQGSYSWYKMGAPDNQELGVYSGISFELGCQVDCALASPQSGKAIPVEFKNRVHHFPARLPEHERVQVQAQLQLCNAPTGILVERLQLSDGTVLCQWHEVVRNDQQWQDRIMPALHTFMAVVARLATEQEDLDLYLSKRSSNQHHSYLKQLLRQQAVCAPEYSC